MMTDELALYDYDLPPQLIAQEPLADRLAARLMVVDRATGAILHRQVRDLPQFLRSGDCLVLNDTKVLPARLEGVRTATGGHWEGLFLEFVGGDGQDWKIIGQTRGKLSLGEMLTLHNADESLQVQLLEKTPDGSWIVRPLSDENPVAALERIGSVPLPPYIRDGKGGPADRESYQTVYADKPGAVAAPTAGLHFTDELLAEIRGLGVVICPVTLHVGIGTFRPVSVKRLADHQMHSEFASIPNEIVRQIRKQKESGARVIAIGTTSMRTLESAAADGTLRPYHGQTDLFIRPPYKFQCVDALLTNFHFPRSTLLVLLHTFGGDALMRQAYEEAVRLEYRFYSYGDAMIVF